MDDLVTQLQHPQLIASPMLSGESWQDLARQREAAREMGVEGMMLKQRQAATAWAAPRTSAPGGSGR
jgi:DNA ligase-1